MTLSAVSLRGGSQGFALLSGAALFRLGRGGIAAAVSKGSIAPKAPTSGESASARAAILRNREAVREGMKSNQGVVSAIFR
jgi:hypothetical protein